MATAYNIKDKLFLNAAANVATLRDPGSAGVIRLGGKDRALCVVSGAGARTIESATYTPVGVGLLVISQTDGVTVNGVTINDGGHQEFIVTLSAAGVSQWVPRGSDVSAGGAVNVQLGNNWRTWDAIMTNLPATSANDDLGLVTGTYGTAAPTLNMTQATPSNVTRYARTQVVVPSGYKAGANLALRVTATQTVAATTATLDVECVRQAAPSVDICATAAQSIIGASSTVYSFTLTGTNVVPGDVLDIRLAILLNDGAATPNYSVTAVSLDVTA